MPDRVRYTHRKRKCWAYMTPRTSTMVIKTHRKTRKAVPGCAIKMRVNTSTASKHKPKPWKSSW